MVAVVALTATAKARVRGRARAAGIPYRRPAGIGRPQARQWIDTLLMQRPLRRGNATD
jgi:hypothetical protein